MCTVKHPSSMSLYFWKRVWIIILVGVSFVSFGAVYITIISITNFHHSLNSLEELGEISCFCVRSWQSKVVEQQQEDDEAIIVLVFHSPNDRRHWPSTAGEGRAFVIQNLPWLLLSQE